MNKFNKDINRTVITGILRNGNLLIKIGNRLAGKYKLTQQQWVLLEALKKEKKGLKLTTLSKNLLVTKSNITGLIDRLELGAYVKRIREKKDRRTLIAKITRKGLNVLKKIRQSEARWNKLCFADFSDKEKSNYLRLLKKHFEFLYQDIYKKG